jgi:hypothetical protein
MKKFFNKVIAIAALCCAVLTANAQEEVQFVTTGNPADVEFSGSLLAAKYNYGYVINKAGLHKDITRPLSAMTACPPT